MSTETRITHRCDRCRRVLVESSVADEAKIAQGLSGTTDVYADVKIGYALSSNEKPREISYGELCDECQLDVSCFFEPLKNQYFKLSEGNEARQFFEKLMAMEEEAHPNEKSSVRQRVNSTLYRAYRMMGPAYYRREQK